MAGPVQEQAENWRRLIAVNFLSPELLACQGPSSRGPAGCRYLSPGQGGDTGRQHLPQQHHRPGEFTAATPAPGRASRTGAPGAAPGAQGRTLLSQSLWAAAAPSEHRVPRAQHLGHADTGHNLSKKSALLSSRACRKPWILSSRRAVHFCSSVRRRRESPWVTQPSCCSFLVT